jgi:hypothetical protein
MEGWTAPLDAMLDYSREIARAVDFPHPACAEPFHDLVRPETDATRKHHS